MIRRFEKFSLVVEVSRFANCRNCHRTLCEFSESIGFHTMNRSYGSVLKWSPRELPPSRASGSQDLEPGMYCRGCIGEDTGASFPQALHRPRRPVGEEWREPKREPKRVLRRESKGKLKRIHKFYRRAELSSEHGDQVSYKCEL